MDKLTFYKELVEEVRACRLCDGIVTYNKGEPVILEHAPQCQHVNYWAYWQGSLDADILLVGQDWGRLDFKEQQNIFYKHELGIPYMSDSTDKTNLAVVNLFKEALSIDAEKPNRRLFFTNSVFCYKSGSAQNPTNEKWFNTCNNRFMGRLIGMIQPEIIIAMGERATNALKYCANVSFTELDGEKLHKRSFMESVNHGAIRMMLKRQDGSLSSIIVPVYHCGVQSTNRNRHYQQQLSDWKRIKPFL